MILSDNEPIVIGIYMYTNECLNYLIQILNEAFV